MSTTNIESDHFTAPVDDGAGLRRLELLGLNESFANAHDRRLLFTKLDDAGLQKTVGYINSLTRGAKSLDHEYADGTLPGEPMPPLKDKKPLMDMTFSAVREILSDDELDDHTALRRAGLTMAGAINYIHPKENGNGRTGRVLLYLMEHGTERGDQAFEEELHAIIGKGRVYESDEYKALDDTPTPEMGKALFSKLKEQGFDSDDDQEWASARVALFLDAMKGRVTVPIKQKARVAQGSLLDGNRNDFIFQPGETDVRSLYDLNSAVRSEVSRGNPEDRPENAERIVGVRKQANPNSMMPNPLSFDDPV